MMKEPRTAMGLRRLRILRLLAGAHGPTTTASIALRVGVKPRSILGHLRVLVALGCVTRSNYRRWQLADGFSIKSFDLSRLDGDQSANS